MHIKNFTLMVATVILLGIITATFTEYLTQSSKESVKLEQPNNNETKIIWDAVAGDIVTLELKKLFDLKAKALLSGNEENISSFFDLSSTVGQWAYEHEQRRIIYVTSWVKNRNLKFTAIHSDFRIIDLEHKAGSTWIYLVETMSANYKHHNREAENFFGIGIRHAIEMVPKNGKLLIKRDWYIDPLDEDTVVQDASPAAGTYIHQSNTTASSSANFGDPNTGGRYNREQAVKYADLYNGGAFKTEKGYRYNQKYRDFTALGGDCTNFVSQCLSDPEGGTLATDYVWFYKNNTGSQTWLQADKLAHYLIGSGMGSLIARGKYEEILKYLSDMQKGDLIAYEEKGDIVHFAIITGFDSNSIPVVNSHTADRYHVPWDLGWDRKTVFWLIHING